MKEVPIWRLDKKLFKKKTERPAQSTTASDLIPPPLPDTKTLLEQSFSPSHYYSFPSNTSVNDLAIAVGKGIDSDSISNTQKMLLPGFSLALTHSILEKVSSHPQGCSELELKNIIIESVNHLSNPTRIKTELKTGNPRETMTLLMSKIFNEGNILSAADSFKHRADYRAAVNDIVDQLIIFIKKSSE
jgi:hypothetical protein